MSDVNYKTAFCHIILAGSSAWTFKILSQQTNGYRWAYGTLGLFFIKSCVGVVRFGHPEHGSKLRHVYNQIFVMSTIFALPCIATDLYLYHHYRWEVAVLHVGLGLIPLLSCNSEIGNDLVRLFLTGNILSVCYLGAVKENYYAIATAVCFAINVFGIGRNHFNSETSTLDLWALGCCFFNYFSLRALQD